MNRFRLSWFNLFTTLNALILPKDVVVEKVEDGDDILTAIAKLQAQIDELNA